MIIKILNYMSMIADMTYQNILHFLSEKMTCEKTMDLLCEICSLKLDFDHIFHLLGLALADCAWEGNGELLVKSGTVTMMELPAYREDIYDMVDAHMGLELCTGADFPFKVMDAATPWPA